MSTQETPKISVSDLRWLYLGGKKTLLIVVGCFLAGMILLRIGFSYWSSARQARQASVTTLAQVTDKGQRLDKQKDPSGDGKGFYWLRYRYRDLDGHSHEGRVTLEQYEWSKFEKYDDISIEFRRDRPEESQLAVVPSFTARWIQMMSLTFGGILYGGSLVCAVGGWMWATRKARCVVRGTPALGEVTERYSPFWARLVAPARARLYFQFIDAHGYLQSGKSHWLPEDIACYWTQGDSILVLCGPDEPVRLEADVFQVRPEDKERLLIDSQPKPMIRSALASR